MENSSADSTHFKAKQTRILKKKKKSKPRMHDRENVQIQVKRMTNGGA